MANMQFFRVVDRLDFTFGIEGNNGKILTSLY